MPPSYIYIHTYKHLFFFFSLYHFRFSMDDTCAHLYTSSYRLCWSIILAKAPSYFDHKVSDNLFCHWIRHKSLLFSTSSILCGDFFFSHYPHRLPFTKHFCCQVFFFFFFCFQRFSFFFFFFKMFSNGLKNRRIKCCWWEMEVNIFFLNFF